MSNSESAALNTSFYGFSFSTKLFEDSGPNIPKNDILGMKFKKTIVEFKVSTFKYPFTSNFILNKELSSFGIKFAQKKYFGGEI